MSGDGEGQGGNPARADFVRAVRIANVATYVRLQCDFRIPILLEIDFSWYILSSMVGSSFARKRAPPRGNLPHMNEMQCLPRSSFLRILLVYLFASRLPPTGR